MNDFKDSNPSINESQSNFIGSQIINPSAEIITDHFDTSSPKNKIEDILCNNTIIDDITHGITDTYNV